MFSGEVAIARAFPLGAGKARILAGFPVGIRSQHRRNTGGNIQGGQAIPFRGDTWEDGLKLPEELPRVVPNRFGIVQIAGKVGAYLSAGVIHQNSGVPALSARRIPGVLKPRIGKAGSVPDSPGATPIPQPSAELQMQFRIRAIPEFLDSDPLSVIEARGTVIQTPQNGERQR